MGNIEVGATKVVNNGSVPTPDGTPTARTLDRSIYRTTKGQGCSSL
jgi:hypothetical protein